MNRFRRAITACLTSLLVVLPVVSSNVASAQGTPDDKQQCIAAAESGQTQRDDGHYRAARDSFLACSRESCPPIIVRSCTQWLHDMAEVTPTVVLAAKDDQGNDLTDVKVTLDGQPLATVLEGKPLEADSGEHVFLFEREGVLPAEQKVVLRAGEKARVVTVVLHSVVPERKAAPPAPRQTSGAPMTARNVTAGAIGVGALAAAGIGVAFLVQSSQASSDAATLRAGLSPSACANSGLPACQPLSDKVNAQYRDLNTSTGLFVTAGGLAVVALVTFLVWPSGTGQQTMAGWILPTPGGGTMGFQGSFE